jgi:hypothetical protein
MLASDGHSESRAADFLPEQILFGRRILSELTRALEHVS